MSHLYKEIDGHQVDGVLGEGGMGSVYRVRHRDSQVELALKLLHPTAHESHLDVLRFKREFKLAARLEHPSLVKVFEMGKSDDRHYFTMELVQGLPLSKAFKGGAPSLDQLNALGAQLLEALAYIHSCEVIHRDLKPDNLILQSDGRVRLLDFGLHFERSAVRLTRSDMILGTLAYMAPEQVTGVGLDRRSDLYSLGVILYEIASEGHSPFPGGDATQRLSQLVMGTPPIPLREVAPELPPEVAGVIDQLLASDPDQRFSSAGAALSAWNEAVGGEGRSLEDLGWSSRTGRLFKPRLCGREQTMERFIEALEELQKGTPAYLLVEAGPGLGKSRVLDELGSYLKGRDIPFFRAAAEQYRRVPYGLWLSTLKSILDRGLQSGLEVFRPAMEALLGLSAENEEEGQLQKAQLLVGGARLLEDFAADKGLVLLLDDLQWADRASVELLSHIVYRLSPIRVLVVATCDNDDTAPSVASDQFEKLRLRNLYESEVEQMASSMLGGAVAAEIPAILTHESEGNPLFVVEAVNSLVSRQILVNDQGHWVLELHPDDESWPSDLVDAVKNRLASITERERRVLETASVLGQQFRFQTLASVGEFEAEELLERLESLIASRVLAEGEDYIFTHHRIRDAVLSEMAPEVRKRLHLEAALVLEESGDADAYTLAHHHYHSDSPEKGAAHLLKAAKLASRSFAHEEAVRHYSALRRFGNSGIEEWEILEALADAHLGAGRPDAAKELFGQSATQAQSSLEKARLHRKLGKCWHLQGDYEEARLHLRTAMTELEPSVAGLWFGSESARASEVRELVLETFQVNYFRRGEGWQEETLRSLLLELAALKQLGSAQASSRILFILGFVMLNGPKTLSSLRQRLLSQAAGLTQRGQDDREKAELLRQIGYGFHLAGKPAEAENFLRESIQISEARADQLGLCEAFLIRCTLHHFWGRLIEARLYGEKALHLAREAGERRVEMMVCSDLSHLALLRGEKDEAKEYHQALRAHPAAVSSPFANMISDMIFGWIQEERGSHAWALELARTNQARCRRLKGENFYLAVFQCQELTSLLSLADKASQPDEYLHQIKRCLRSFSTGGHWLFEGRRAYFQGRLLALQGDAQGSIEKLGFAHQIFTDLGAYLELAEVEMAFSKVADEERHQGRAKDLYTRAGAALE